MRKHTPGPWTIETPMGEDLWIVEDGKQTYEWRCLAIVPGEGDEDDVPKLQAMANARLIVAAPDMLAALQGAMVIIETVPWPDEAGEGLRAAFDKRREAIRAAIVKATGAAS